MKTNSMNVATSKQSCIYFSFKQHFNFMIFLTKSKYVTVLFRLIIGSIFIVAGLSKLHDSSDFVIAVNNYTFLHSYLRHLIVLILPWLELIVGSYIAIGLFQEITSFVSLGMFSTFACAIGINIFNGKIIECGCFGSIATTMNVGHLIISLILLSMALQINLTGNKFLSIDWWIFKKPLIFQKETTATRNSMIGGDEV